MAGIIGFILGICNVTRCLDQDLRTKFTFNIKITATRVPETGVRRGGIPAKGERLA